MPKSGAGSFSRMSLTASFFIERSKTLDRYKILGYICIDEFEERYSLKIDKIFEAGLLSQRMVKSTTDLYDYHVNSKGKDFMKEIKDLELILVKPDSAKKLADAVTK